MVQREIVREGEGGGAEGYAVVCVEEGWRQLGQRDIQDACCCVH